MARKLRIEMGEALYHVMNRGDRREPIFRDDGGRQGTFAVMGDTFMSPFRLWVTPALIRDPFTLTHVRPPRATRLG